MKSKLSLLCLCLVLTGCNKTLKCKSIIDNDSMKVEQSYVIRYEGNDIKDVKHKIVYDVYDNDLKNNFDMMIGFSKSNFDMYDINYDYEQDDNRYIIKANYSIDSISDEAFTNLIGTNNINEFKTKYENVGFICK